MEEEKKSLSLPKTISLSSHPLFPDRCCFYGSLSSLDFPHSTQAQRQLGTLFFPLNPRLIERSIVLFFSLLLNTDWVKGADLDVVAGRIISVYLHASWQLVIEVHVPIHCIGPEA